MPDPILSTRGLTRRFGGLAAVNGVAMGIEHGRLHAVLGPNGAGKTTLINLLSGDLDASSWGRHLQGRGTSPGTRRIAARGLASAAVIRRRTSSLRSPPSKIAGWRHSRACRGRCISSPMPPRFGRSSSWPTARWKRRALPGAAGALHRRCPRRAAPARNRDGSRHATGGAAARRAACGHGRGGGRAHGGAPAQARAAACDPLWSSTTWMPCSPSPIRLP